jgi:hypothetical protein
MVPHFDNASPHTADDNQSHTVQSIGTGGTSSLSARFSTLIFRRFGQVKIALIDSAFNCDIKLFEGVMHVLKKVPHEELEAVFGQWLARSHAYVKHKRESVV